MRVQVNGSVIHLLQLNLTGQMLLKHIFIHKLLILFLNLLLPLQFRRALNQLNLRTQIEQYVHTLDTDSKDAWEYATVFERNNPIITSATQALNKSTEEVDDLFRLASSL
jgi:hypothetical protein